MSSNIFGYQGVNTPLESLTNGRYNVADYTTLRETVDARLTVLEKQQAVPENVTVNGSLSIVATATGAGTLTAAGSGSFGGTLYASGNIASNGGMVVNQNAHIVGNLYIGGTLSSNDVIFPLNGIQFPDGSTLTTATPAAATPIYVQALFYDQSLHQNITPAYSEYKTVEINFNYSNDCQLYLVNLDCEDSTAFPDGVRYVTVCKPNHVSGVITIYCPHYNSASLNYHFYDGITNDVQIYTMGANIYSVTFVIYKFNGGADRRTYIKGLVNY